MAAARPSLLAAAALLVTPFVSARAELLEAKRASVMCSSAGALARLALPKGGSRDIADPGSPQWLAIARSGGCTDFDQGHVVVVVQQRTHTSIVRSDSLSGDGVTVEAIVANVDFAPFTPPRTPFFDTLRRRCPALLDPVAAEDPPSSSFVASLPAPVRTAIGKVVDDDCGPAAPCEKATRAAEIDRRGLGEGWAAYLCAHAADAVEPMDRSSGPVRP